MLPWNNRLTGQWVRHISLQVMAQYVQFCHLVVALLPAGSLYCLLLLTNRSVWWLCCRVMASQVVSTSPPPENKQLILYISCSCRTCLWKKTKPCPCPSLKYLSEKVGDVMCFNISWVVDFHSSMLPVQNSQLTSPIFDCIAVSLQCLPAPQSHPYKNQLFGTVKNCF